MLPKVNLSDLSAEELAAEMVRRIPAHTPEWRNARPGDPGRAMIDVFAWLGETILYRANLTPRRMRLEFLNLLNMKQRSAMPAKGLLQLTHKAPASAKPVFTRTGTRANGPVPFETLSPVTAQPFAGHVFIKRRLGDAERQDLADVIASLGVLYGAEDAEPYASAQLFGPGSTAIAEGVDPFTDSIDGTLWIALLALDETPAAMSAARAALDAQPCLLNIGFLPRQAEPEGDDEAEPLPEGLEWSVTTTPVAGGIDVPYLDVAVEDDRTAGLHTEGTLRLVLPRANMLFAPSNDIVSEVDAGVGDRPPRLDDPALAARLLGWVRLRPSDEAARLPLSWIGINAVAVDQRQTHADILLGTATGQAGMRFALPAGQVDPDSLRISVFEAGLGYQPWRRVTDLGGCGRDEACYEIDAESGEVVFGDNLTGRGLAAGTRVRLDIMRAGGGEAGNVAAGAITKIEKPGLLVHQPAAMHGGIAAETLEAAEKRVGAMLHHRNRCVTEEDYKSVGAELGLARLEVLPGFRPHQRRENQAGVVTVMVLPAQAVRRPANPRADRRLIERVQAHLDPRRPLGTEFYVVSPEYVSLGVSVAVTLREGFAREEVVKEVKDRLYAHLWPLAGGGTEGTGWPLGRAVRNLELEVEIARLAGVATVPGVNLFGLGETGFQVLPSAPGSQLQTLPVSAWQLPELLGVTVSVGPEAPATTLERPARAGSSVGVPVVPEVC